MAGPIHELTVLGIAASRVIVTTFTREASTELAVRMVERSNALLDQAKRRGLEPADPHVHVLRIGTLHSLCDALLAEFDADYMAEGTEVVDETETRVHRFALGYTVRPPGEVIDRLLAREELVALIRPPWDDGYWPGNKTAARAAPSSTCHAPPVRSGSWVRGVSTSTRGCTWSKESPKS